MITIRKAQERGHADRGWLDTHHTFSFASYYDPNHMGFRSLRVINEDWVSPGAGFSTHGHRDMEIITYVLEGALEHKDSLGTGSVIRPGDVQRMSAGTGILHSEFNHSQTEAVHLLQIWLLPNQHGLAPSYEQHNFGIAKETGKLHLVAAPDGRDGALTIHQEVDLYAGVLNEGQTITYSLAPQRYAWVQVARGTIDLNEVSLDAGDGAVISNETEITIAATHNAEVLLFDLA